MRLRNKTALITGAGRGVGRACALKFASEGADVILLDIAANLEGVPYPLASRSQLQHSADLCAQAGVATFVAAVDIRNLADIAAAVGQAIERFGHIDILVNNAGIAAPSGKIVHDITEDEWELMLNVDLSGAWRMTKVVGRHMAERRSGSIVNVASTAGVVGYRHFAGYVAAKHGMVGLTRASALDYAPLKVRVNALCPGSIRDEPAVEGRMLSEIARSLDVPVAEHEQTFVQAQPMNALIEPDDIAHAAIWLASDESRQVTGSVVTVDGGFTSR